MHKVQSLQLVVFFEILALVVCSNEIYLQRSFYVTGNVSFWHTTCNILQAFHHYNASLVLLLRCMHK